MIKLAKEAVKQIQDQHYDCELSGEIIHIGLAQCSKDVEILWVKK